MKRLALFITGSDTSAGKTVLASLLARHLRGGGLPLAALKPVSSGSRADARALRAAAGALTLDEVNPWHFRAPLAPALAARLEKRTVKLAGVVAHIRRIQQRCPVVVIEGAGGLLSPLGEDFDSRDLITALRAIPIVACPNRLGAVNQALLVLAALPPGAARRARVVLTGASQPDHSGRANLQLLRERLGRGRVHLLPRLKQPRQLDRALADRNIRRTMSLLAGRPAAVHSTRREQSKRLPQNRRRRGAR